MVIRLDELIQHLERLEKLHGGHVEVRIMLPRGWPLVAPISDVAYIDDERDPESARRVVWISGE